VWPTHPHIGFLLAHHIVALKLQAVAATPPVSPNSTPIKAANDGKVVLAEDLYFSGNTVVLDHGLGLYTYYGHCSTMAVKPGDSVARGQVIAEVGATGRVTGPHLHWACRLGEARVNPLELTKVWMAEEPQTNQKTQGR
jgi:murein DD-endopeptidase MepM/ murein hydrolase activator NlpD